ncbi:MAG: hypothetical protein ACR2Q4_12945 [Geminicoccaceae bacterium]
MAKIPCRLRLPFYRLRQNAAERMDADNALPILSMSEIGVVVETPEPRQPMDSQSEIAAPGIIDANTIHLGANLGQK